MGIQKHPEGRQRQALLVLGMHRSGTSALALALERLGWNPGDELLDSQAGINERGFGENRAVVELNEKLLTHFGRRWYQLSPLPAGWEEGDEAQGWGDEAAAIIDRQFGEANRILLKDPRLCLTLPLWLRALEYSGFQVRVILQLRHPESVARSLQRRDRLPLQVGYLLWLDYYLQAERYSRNCERAVMRYEELLQSGAQALRLFPDMEVPEDLDTGLDPGLCHHSSLEFTEPGAIAALCERTLAALENLQQSDNLPPNIPGIADILLELGGEATAGLLDQVLESMVERSAEAVAIGGEHSHALSVIADKDREIEEVTDYARQCEEVVRSKDAEIEEVTSHASHCEEVVRSRDLELEQLRAQGMYRLLRKLRLLR